MSELQRLTKDEQACNAITFEHIMLVRDLINDFIRELLARGETHDQSKLRPPEVAAFTEMTPKLAALTYGSKEYADCKAQLGEALAHHYANNRHHPEHWPGMLNDMNLVDIVEMFCDWLAASKRHNNGNILQSIEHNANRYMMPPLLVNIFQNTAELMDRKRA